MKKLRFALILLFIVIVIIQMIGCWNENLSFEYIAKPWIMPWIAVFFLLYAQKKSFKWSVLLAFFFCWTGDMFLMLANTYEVLFYAGVGGFLIGHIFYISIFIKHYEKNVKGFIARKPLLLTPYILYLLVIMLVLFPVMEGVMRLVITIYGATLILMALAAANRKGRVSQLVFNRIFWGSILFVVSDSMIAFNKFHTEFDKSRVLIMSTYIAAQVLILSGLINEKEKEN